MWSKRVTEKRNNEIVALTAPRWGAWVTVGIERERQNDGSVLPELMLPYGANTELTVMSGSDTMSMNKDRAWRDVAGFQQLERPSLCTTYY